MKDVAALLKFIERSSAPTRTDDHGVHVGWRLKQSNKLFVGVDRFGRRGRSRRQRQLGAGAARAVAGSGRRRWDAFGDRCAESELVLGGLAVLWSGVAVLWVMVHLQVVAAGARMRTASAENRKGPRREKQDDSATQHATTADNKKGTPANLRANHERSSLTPIPYLRELRGQAFYQPFALYRRPLPFPSGDLRESEAP
jgi:hypothetical protein